MEPPFNSFSLKILYHTFQFKQKEEEFDNQKRIINKVYR
ncbi:hypothetical protein KIS4809_0258 [Bacillus sp. ZZV12-4809]|nr:hypothetical protein KIS4809_0258 [Bacillus sp. ZZV12-4809]